MLGILLFGLYFTLFSLVVYYFRSWAQNRWWVKIDTQSPQCTYYFGPFDSEEEAKSLYGDYIEDLQEEGARGISIQIQRCQPQQLTIFEEDSEATCQ